MGQRQYLLIPPVTGSQEPAALTYEKQDNSDQIYADNLHNSLAEWGSY